MLTLSPRTVHLTPRSGVDILRTLPHRDIRTIGAWCFVDNFGPTPQRDAMTVAAHPHTGLQTVSWLFSGEVEHCDSLGSRQIIRPGELNIMTSGHGIAHSERSLDSGIDLHGIQLWVALPEDVRDRRPMFSHHDELPTFDLDSAAGRLILGSFEGLDAGVEVFSPLVGCELTIPAGKSVRVPLNATFEYGIQVAGGMIVVEGQPTHTGTLLYLPAGAHDVTIESPEGALIVVLGGEPFPEQLVMWWNFIGRTRDEIEEMQRDWNSHSDRFPAFEDSLGGRIDAPPLPNARLKARGNTPF